MARCRPQCLSLPGGRQCAHDRGAGGDRVGRPQLSRASRYFPRALGIVYLIAFVSFGIQASGLIGSRGILPLENYLLAIRREMGARAFWYVPTIFWINASDFALRLAS